MQAQGFAARRPHERSVSVGRWGRVLPKRHRFEETCLDLEQFTLAMHISRCKRKKPRHAGRCPFRSAVTVFIAFDSQTEHRGEKRKTIEVGHVWNRAQWESSFEGSGGL